MWDVIAAMAAAGLVYIGYNVEWSCEDRGVIESCGIHWR